MNEGMKLAYRGGEHRGVHARTMIHAMRQLRENGDFYVPDFLTGVPRTSRRGVYAAANQHAAELRQAEQDLDEVLNLVRVLRASVQGEDDGRAMQADTVLKIIENKLGEARNCMDRHDARYLNLFMAYFDLKARSTGPGGN